jgi:hypothetical protein
MSADRVEFYVEDGLVCSCQSSIVPSPGSDVCIAKKFYEVVKVSYAVDDSQIAFQEKMRAAVWLKEKK